MKAIITGAGGFLGGRLALELAQRAALTLAPDSATQPISELVLVDLQIPGALRAALGAFGVPLSIHEGDITDPAFRDRWLPPPSGARASTRSGHEFVLFHLASIISGTAEQDFDLALRVNFDATRALMERCRAYRSAGHPAPRIVFASSLATFGGHAMTPVVSDATKQIPQTTYGMTKLMGELMINDYARKGFVDGRAARLPTIFIRAGAPNTAASSFASSLFREPLRGVGTKLPVTREQKVPLLSYIQTIDAFIRLAEVDGKRLGDDRTVTLPSTQYGIQEMIDALEAVAAAHSVTLGPIEFEPDPVVQRIVAGWPVGTDGARAEAIGVRTDSSLQAVIERYMQDFPEAVNKR